MKWSAKKNQRPKIGDRRVVRKFAFLPTIVGDQYFWLEKYHAIQQFKPALVMDTETQGIYMGRWQDEELVENFWQMLPAKHNKYTNRWFEIESDVIYTEYPVTPRQAGKLIKERYIKEYCEANSLTNFDYSKA